MLTKPPILNFEAPTTENYNKILDFIRPFSEDTMSCEVAPLTLLLWKDYYHQQVAFFKDMLFISLGEDNDIFLLPFARDITAATELLRDYAHSKSRPLVILGAEGPRLDAFKGIFGEQFSQTESRDDFEYLYSTASLKGLQGKRYHSKRNHISAFSRAYDWHYEPLCEDNLPLIFEMADRWTEQTCATAEDPESIKKENAALKKYLPHFKALNIRGGCICVKGRVVAFTFGTPLNSRVFDVHVEKALPEFRTAYTVINREFIAHELGDFEYVNREDDMGIEGLRKAKLSYHPDILLKKYVIEEV